MQLHISEDAESKETERFLEAQVVTHDSKARSYDEWAQCCSFVTLRLSLPCFRAQSLLWVAVTKQSADGFRLFSSFRS